MRVMVIVKATKESEVETNPAGTHPELLAEMMRFNDELVKAGVMQDGAGLKPSSHGKRVRMGASGADRAVLDGPFAETKELVAGFWIWKVASMDEAVAWAKRCPNPHPGHDDALEIRPLWEEDDFKK